MGNVQFYIHRISLCCPSGRVVVGFNFRNQLPNFRTHGKTVQQNLYPNFSANQKRHLDKMSRKIINFLSPWWWSIRYRDKWKWRNMLKIPCKSNCRYENNIFVWVLMIILLKPVFTDVESNGIGSLAYGRQIGIRSTVLLSTFWHHLEGSQKLEV